MVDGERESNGGSAECTGAVVDRSGDGVDGSGMVVENEPIELEKAAGGSVNGSTIEVAVNGSAIDAENGPIEVEKGACGSVNGSAIGVEDGAVDEVNGLAMDVENDRIEVEKGADKATNGFATEAENVAADVGNGFKTKVETWALGDGNSTGSSCEGLRTYKRRRLNKMASLEIKLPVDGNVSADSVSRLPDKTFTKFPRFTKQEKDVFTFLRHQSRQGA